MKKGFYFSSSDFLSHFLILFYIIKKQKFNHLKTKCIFYKNKILFYFIFFLKYVGRYIRKEGIYIILRYIEYLYRYIKKMVCLARTGINTWK